MSIKADDDQDEVNIRVLRLSRVSHRNVESLWSGGSGHCKNNKCSWRLAF